MTTPLPPAIAALTVKDASKIDEVAGGVDVIFCAVDMPKDETRALEEALRQDGDPRRLQQLGPPHDAGRAHDAPRGEPSPPGGHRGPAQDAWA